MILSLKDTIVNKSLYTTSKKIEPKENETNKDKKIEENQENKSDFIEFRTIHKFRPE